MKAMLLNHVQTPLTLQNIPIPKPKTGEILVKISACGVCRTDLHILDGELTETQFPIILGHQIVGRVDSDSKRFQKGQKIGIPWLGGSCGHCYYCNHNKENLCESAIYTGYQKNGGFAEYCVAHEDFCFPIPENYSDIDAAPLLCAGLIGYRSYKKCGDCETIGFYGFGAAAHILTQLAIYQGKKVYAFTQKNDFKGQKFAKKLGAFWAGDSETSPPDPLDAAIIFAPVGQLVLTALKAIRKGGSVVCAGIHMSDIPSFPYSLIWGERNIQSVANLTRKDGEEFLTLAPQVPIRTETSIYSLEKANEALKDLKEGNFQGAAVIKIADI